MLFIIYMKTKLRLIKKKNATPQSACFETIEVCIKQPYATITKDYVKVLLKLSSIAKK